MAKKVVATGFWDIDVHVPIRKEWETYHRAVERSGMVVIERVYPPVGDTTKETVFDAALLTYAEADALIPQMMAAMASIKATMAGKAALAAEKEKADA